MNFDIAPIDTTNDFLDTDSEEERESGSEEVENEESQHSLSSPRILHLDESYEDNIVITNLRARLKAVLKSHYALSEELFSNAVEQFPDEEIRFVHPVERNPKKKRILPCKEESFTREREHH